eukprot:CAMPEP_0176410338 /NCGR_PEP_ID=MMETSP0127-20121128/3002_1 /TAXON_ID=938130 /ORGANISM="Platyophrya macrostoma, Strain WH" /LENGTH=535 /DNA_ID=CAMNT_0017789825 /DNA_START=148 /DNA_END=1756 /DNA_ORIENTATION=+
METSTLVWVKVEGYPWWPAVVIDKDTFESMSGIQMSEGKDTAVQFLGTGDTACVDSGAPEEVVPFLPEADSDKMSPGDEGCAAAIAYAMDMWTKAVAAASSSDAQPQDDGDAAAHASNSDEDGSEDDDNAAQSHRKEKKEKKDKKDKKERKKEKKREKERKKKDRKKSRRADSDGEDAVISEAALSDDDAHARAKKHRRKESAAASYHNSSSIHVMSVSEATSGALRRKRTPTNSELTHLRDELVAAMQTTDLHRARVALSELAKVCVTASQLKRTKIGIILSTLLSPEHPLAACGLLVRGILKYWLSQLPETLQERLSSADEVDFASNASQEDADEPVEDIATLDAYGLNVERCFMVEEAELNDDAGDDDPDKESEKDRSDSTVVAAPPSVPAAHIAKLIEAEIPAHLSDLRDVTLTYLKSSEHNEIRRRLLTESLTVPEFVAMIKRSITDVSSSPTGAATSTTAANSSDLVSTAGVDGGAQILDESVEDEYDNVTHQFTCPYCDHHSAQTSEMTTGSHGEDHVTVLWARAPDV